MTVADELKANGFADIRIALMQDKDHYLVEATKQGYAHHVQAPDYMKSWRVICWSDRNFNSWTHATLGMKNREIWFVFSDPEDAVFFKLMIDEF